MRPHFIACTPAEACPQGRRGSEVVRPSVRFPRHGNADQEMERIPRESSPNLSMRKPYE